MVPGSRSLVRTRWEPGDPRQVELRGRAVEEGHARLGWAAPQGGLRAGGGGLPSPPHSQRPRVAGRPTGAVGSDLARQMRGLQGERWSRGQQRPLTPPHQLPPLHWPQGWGRHRLLRQGGQRVGGSRGSAHREGGQCGSCSGSGAAPTRSPPGRERPVAWASVGPWVLTGVH